MLDMSVGWDNTGACACYSIKNLGVMPNAEIAMQRFCQVTLLKNKGRFSYDAYPKFKYNILPAFIIFVSGPDVSGKKWSREWTKYGSDFAKFIRQNRLGTVVTAGKSLNRKHHLSEGTTAQVWLWKTNQDAIEQWWKNRVENKQIQPRPLRPKSRDNNHQTCPTCRHYAKNHDTNWKCPVDRYSYSIGPRVDTFWPEFETYDLFGKVIK